MLFSFLFIPKFPKIVELVALHPSPFRGRTPPLLSSRIRLGSISLAYYDIGGLILPTFCILEFRTFGHRYYIQVLHLVKTVTYPFSRFSNNFYKTL